MGKEDQDILVNYIRSIKDHIDDKFNRSDKKFDELFRKLEETEKKRTECEKHNGTRITKLEVITKIVCGIITFTVIATISYLAGFWTIHLPLK